MTDVVTIGKYNYHDDPIGKGSFSFVFKGWHKKSNNNVAIKKINLSSLSMNMKYHIKSEIAIMEKLEHSNIIQLYDVIYKDECVYLIMEFCPLGDLSKFLNNKPLKEKYCWKFIKQIADATEYLLSNNILHRDLKPQNIMLFDTYHIKLSDFGFAKILKKDDSMYNTICGSPIYMAPEIIKHNNYDIKTDLWSIGVIMYEIIVGKPPYKASTHYELICKIDKNPIFIPTSIKISDDCRDLIHGLLQKNPQKRITWNNFFQHDWLDDYNYDYDEKQIENNNDNNIEDDNLKTSVISNSIIIEDYTEDNFFINSRAKSIENYYDSLMFNTPTSTPSDKNGYILVDKSINNEDNDKEGEIDIERSVSESFLNYMQDGINYLKSYYWDD